MIQNFNDSLISVKIKLVKTYQFKIILCFFLKYSFYVCLAERIIFRINW